MKTTITIQVEVSRAELRLDHWEKAFPSPTQPTKAPEQKDDDPAWKASLADFEVKKGLHARAISAAGAQAGHAAKYCELMGMEIGVGDHCPMVISKKIEDPTPDQIEAERRAMVEWIEATMVRARLSYLNQRPGRNDFMFKELKLMAGRVGSDGEELRE